MGAGNKLDPGRFCVTDLSKTSGCPLARVMRRELKVRGITHLKVVYSTEPAAPQAEDVPQTPGDQNGKKRAPGSLSFVPSVAGLMMAGEIVKDLISVRP
ncbi:MAG: tRNA threonylcarbamoyladenosine dehydratase, partial [Clostridia bacterium]|nr:tRNA threonylcarbamoyladenosine dehydratase [Clostridia bacterium]